MHLALATTLLLGSLPFFAVAQSTQAAATPATTTTSTDAKCAAQNIVDDCLQRMGDQLKTCGPNEWKCLCEQQGNVVTCYNNCPGSAAAGPEKQKEETYCNAAKTLPSSSTKIATTSTSAASSTKNSSTSTAASSTSTSKGAATLPTAAFGTVEGGLMLGVMLGVLGV
ncbi:GPI anchored serine-threonine rich protein [Aspergillus alliaceus]|uniref:GPI anchored serine-threonine rich protein n=1 Tax=Petromyces alliaceus TaxID=209559 RepID=UPI0012A4F4C2|nr:uncharacterized protein BDW43DRAFT_316554 [Aspergillus alliaceus]KAB8227756.1 hypothetical protein BDW43DRAFT_316554 [Aspergillus alliaceus]